MLLALAVLAGAGWWALDRPAASASASSPALAAALTAAQDTAGGSVGVVVRSPAGAALATSSDAGQQRYTASLVKLLVVQQLLERAATGRVHLSAADRSDMRRAVERSDDTAMNRLWVAHGGAELVRAAAAEFGLGHTAPPAVAGQWGQTTTTAEDLATFLGHLADHLRAADRATLTGWMRAATAHGADGFDQAFGLRSAAVDGAGDVAVKQGWMCCVDRTRQLHSVGVLPDGTVVVLLGQFPESTSWAAAHAALDHTAGSVVDALR